MSPSDNFKLFWTQNLYIIFKIHTHPFQSHLPKLNNQLIIEILFESAQQIQYLMGSQFQQGFQN